MKDWAGADTLDGGGGTDTLSYESSNAGVTIDLERGTGDFDETNNTIKTSSGGHATGDKVKFGSFVHIIGSAHRDTLTGDNNDNTLKGGGGNDTLNGDDGDDMLVGGPGSDTLDGGDGDTGIPPPTLMLRPRLPLISPAAPTGARPEMRAAIPIKTSSYMWGPHTMTPSSPAGTQIISTAVEVRTPSPTKNREKRSRWI